MRNLAMSPVTATEVVSCLHALAEGYAAEGAMGDMRPLILRIVLQMIHDNPELLEKAIKA